MADLLRSPLLAARCLAIVLLISLASSASAQNSLPATSFQAPPPAFTDSDGMAILATLQSALQSYNRKRFLAAFDAAAMPDFPAFRNQVGNLFDRYDSFTITYHVLQTAMEGSNGVVLADFGVDGTSIDEDQPDLRRDAQLRLVLGWNGKEWKIVQLSPRALLE